MKKIFLLKTYLFLVLMFLNTQVSWGQVANALNFDGIDDYVEATLPQGYTQGTVELWVHLNNSQATNQSIIKMGDISIHRTSTGSLIYTRGNKVSTTTQTYIDTSIHIAMVWKDDGYFMGYVNGMQVVSQGPNPPTTSGASVQLGKQQTGLPNLNYFNGTIDDVRIWNSVRTSSQIANNKNCPLTGSETGLVVYYNFNQGIGGGINTNMDTLYDNTTNGINGTLHNFQLSGNTSNWVTSVFYTTPTVSLTSNAVNNTIISGTSVHFTATPVNGGATPTYQWKKNGVNVGTNSPNYTDAGLVDGDSISVELITTCNNVTSNAILMTVTLSTTPPTNTVVPNYTTGSYYWSDLVLEGNNYDFEIFYNSQDTVQGSMCGHWSHTYNIYLNISGNQWTMYRGNGEATYFMYNNGVATSLYGTTDTMYISGSDYILETQMGIKYTFDANGVLQTISDRNNNTTTLTYNGGLLDRVTFVDSRYLDFGYNGSNLLISVTDNANRSVSFTYDGNCDLTTYTDIDNNTTTFTYGSNHQMTNVTNPNGNSSQRTFTNGKVTGITTAVGRTFSIQYNTPIANARTITDALGNTSIEYYDNSYNLIQKTNELGGNIYYQYNSLNLVTQIINESGDTSYFNYDTRGNLIGTQDELGNTTSIVYNALNLPTAITNKAGHTTTYTYDANGNNTSATFPNGSSVTATYNSHGQKIAQVDQNGNTTTYQYDGTTLALTGVTTPTGTSTLTYDNIGQLTSATDRNGKTTTLLYNTAGQLTKITDPMTYFVEYTYDANGNVLTVKDKNGGITTYTYDADDRITTVTNALNQVTTYTYDLMNQVTAVTDALNNAITYAYDAKGQVTSVTNALGTTSYTYDGAGNLLTSTDALGFTTTFGYDELDRPITVTNPLNQTQTTLYTVLGQVAAVVDAAGDSTTYSYNGMGWLTQVKDALGGLNTLTYDNKGNRLTYTDANSQTTTFTYNSLDLMLTETDAAGHTTTYTYDNEGNQITVIDPNGETLTMTYNDNYLPTQVTFSNGGTNSYTYNNNGSLLTATNANGTTTFVRNALDKITQSTDPFGNVTGYGYNNVNLITSIDYGNSETVNITYNAAYLPTNVSDWAGNYTNRTYNANGLLTNITNSNGTTTIITNDELSRTATYTNFQPNNAIINSDTLTHDNVGRIVNRATIAPMPVVIPTATTTFQYGNDNRLTASSASSYTTDNNGARTSSTMNNAAYTWGEGGLLKTYTLNAIVTQNFHDANRNLIKQIKDGVETRYQLDHTGEDHTGIVTQVLRELDDQNNVIASYIYVPGDGLAWRLNTQDAAQFYAFDYIGHTNALTDENGNITDTYALDIFGNNPTHSGTTEQPFQFLGQHGVQHKGNEHYHIRARDYDGNTGTFLSKDVYPIDFNNTQALNEYAYVQNNPFSFVDVNGFGFLSRVIRDLLKGKTSSKPRIKGFPAIKVAPENKGETKTVSQENLQTNEVIEGWHKVENDSTGEIIFESPRRTPNMKMSCKLTRGGGGRKYISTTDFKNLHHFEMLKFIPLYVYRKSMKYINTLHGVC